MKKGKFKKEVQAETMLHLLKDSKAVKFQSLDDESFANSRDVRKRIQNLRRNNVIVNVLDGNGYQLISKIKTEADYEIAMQFFEQELSRACAVLANLNPVLKMLGEEKQKYACVKKIVERNNAQKVVDFLAKMTA